MEEIDQREISTAIDDFWRARNQADLQELISRFTGEQTQLLSFDEVKKMLRLQASADIGLRDIPLEAIVGSVGRYTDFTRDFLPRRKIHPERWARIKTAASGLVGLPPIEAYKIGDVYFVKDGNHRVSVARQLGATYIQAYVTEVRTDIPITPDIRPDDLIVKAEYALFLERTKLNQLSPKPDFSTTIPGQYQILLEHIDVHRYYMGLEYQRYIPYPEAATHWYEVVYQPIVEIIRSQKILRRFPERTETDLYLWIAQHRAELEEQLGWQIKTQYAASNLAELHGANPSQIFSWIGEKLHLTNNPENHETTTSTGKSYSDDPGNQTKENLFMDILVPENGEADGWYALEQAIIIAQKENAYLHGLHVVPPDTQEDSPSPQEVKEIFDARCLEAGIKGSLTITTGNVVDQICKFAIGTDLVVANLSYPPENNILSKLGSGFHDLVKKSPRPLFVTPQNSRDIHCAILAFDGSPKAFEALYLAAYLSSFWKCTLSVINVQENSQIGEQNLEQARQYLEARHVAAEYYLKEKPVAEAILHLAEEKNCDLIIVGGYSANPLLQVLIDSTVNYILRESTLPILICK